MEPTVCPGCHFGCRIDTFQCGRGEKLYARWVETGELPERRIPGATGRERPAMPVDERLMHMLHIVGIALADLADESGSSAPERRVLDCLTRHGNAASAAILEGRTHLDELDAALDAVQAQGYVATRPGAASTLYELTELGAEQAHGWNAERQAADAAFLGVLDEAEKEQLLALVMKLLEPGFKRRQAR